MIESGRYTSGRIAVTNLSASIHGLEHRRATRARFDDLFALSRLLFVRGDLLARMADHDGAELIATEAAACSQNPAGALYVRARLAGRFHRFGEVDRLLDAALAAGYAGRDVATERAALLQATGRYAEALELRERLAEEDLGAPTLGALASVLADMDRWTAAEAYYAAALDADNGSSPVSAGELLFEWGVSAMRRRELDRAETVLAALAALLPQHVPAQGRRAEVALARGQLDVALALIAPLVDISDDPEYRGTYAEVLAARSDRDAASREAARAAAAYRLLLARRPEAYADQAARFFLGAGNDPQRALELALLNRRHRETPRARNLVAQARRAVAAKDGTTARAGDGDRRAVIHRFRHTR